MNFITKEKFFEIATGNKCPNWSVIEERWTYHKLAIDTIKHIGLKNPNDILEVGTLGASLVDGSDTLDFDKKWNYKGMNPTYLHDLRRLPWPIKDKQYELVTFLRVFHHLKEKQHKCFSEAKRIAKRIIIVVPTVCRGFGIKIEAFNKWNKGVPPTIYKNMETIGKLDGENNFYYWDLT